MAHVKIWNAWEKQRAVCTDSRKIRQGDLFFALKGENFDGNRFAAGALEQGAAYVIVDDPAVVAAGDDRYILVPDVLRALQALARAWRDTFQIPFIGITGTNGKTTTKELVHAVLATEKRVRATQGNLNNHIGVPLTILSLTHDLDIAVIEQGANHRNDIRETCDIANPTHGLITNIGYAHLEGFGGVEGVEVTKREMFDHMALYGGTAWVNAGDPRVLRASYQVQNRVFYGGQDAPYRLLSWDESGTGAEAVVALPDGSTLTLHTHLIGRHNADNLLVAVVAGMECGISREGIQRGIAGYVPTMNRTQLVELPGLRVLMDAYNANPSSMKAAITAVFSQPRGQVALVLGDMFELGDEAEMHHAQVVAHAAQYRPALLVGVGPHMSQALAGLHGVHTAAFADTAAALGSIRELLHGMDFMLLKGSRGMALEKLMEALR